MTRARIKNYKNVDKNKLKVIISNIDTEELKEIANLYYIKEYSQLDISFELNCCEKTIQRKIKEVNKMIESSI